MKLRRRLAEGGALPLTPLIDVMFQVLLYYMLTSSVSINPALRVDLPQAYSSTDATPQEIVVTIGAGGEIAVGDRIVPEESLVPVLREAAARAVSTRVLLLGDASIPYQTLVTVMDKVRLAGLESVSLGTVKTALPPP